MNPIDQKFPLKIIDAHVHFSKIAVFEECAANSSMLDYSYGGYLRETAACGVAGSICMGLNETAPYAFPDRAARTPMNAGLAEHLPPGMLLCPGVNPHALDARALGELDEMAGVKKIVGFKLYPGYYFYGVCDPVYDPVYSIAMKHGLPVAIHSGEPYSERGLLEYSHPLAIDRLAVRLPDLKIIVCHMGAPWVFDACEVAGKNANVYLDVSGLLVGSAEYIERMSSNRLVMDRYAQPLALMDNYTKVLFGTDWPLAPFGAYVEFIKKLIPEEAHEDVFHNNAASVYTAVSG